MMVFDLDPGAPAAILECAQVGLWLRELLDELGLESFAKTSGSKGLQVYVPLNTPVTYDETKPFAHALAQLLEKQHPELVVSNMKKELRKGKVFVDWSQNDDFKTTVCVYSLRARERPTVSTPVTWDEVEEALDSARRRAGSCSTPRTCWSGSSRARRPVRAGAASWSRRCPAFSPAGLELSAPAARARS